MYLMKLILMSDQEVIARKTIMKFHGILAEYPKGSPVKEIFQISLREEKIQDKAIKFQLWEFTSKIELETQRNVFFLGSIGGIMVFDVTNKTTFDKCIKWIKEIWSKIGKPIPIVVIGLKTSQISEKIYKETRKEISDQIKKLNSNIHSNGNEVYYSEIEELSDLTVDSVFEYLGKIYLKNLLIEK